MGKTHHFSTSVTHEDGMWIAVCDELGLVTEALTYNALIDRVLGLAPEMFIENHYGIDTRGRLISRNTPKEGTEQVNAHPAP